MRILWQSFLDLDIHAAYITRLRALLAEIAGPGVTYEIVGLTPPDAHIHRLTELRGGITAIRNAIAAERAGYDAFIVGHFQEPGLDDMRSTLDIPVVGLGECSLLYASTIGRKIGLVTIDPKFIPWHEQQVAHLGLQTRVVGVTAMTSDPALFMRAFEDAGALAEARALFEEQCGPLLAAGADVLVPAGGLPAMLFGGESNFRVGGAPVVNNLVVAAKHAELAVELRRLTGIAPSRVLAFVKPSPEALQQFVEQTGGPLQEVPLWQ